MITTLFLVTWLQSFSIILQVQVVDSGWLPVPGITFHVQRVSSCSESVKLNDPKGLSATTKAGDGTASVAVHADAYYRLTFDGEGGFKPVNKCVHIGTSQPPEPKAYVQIQINVR